MNILFFSWKLWCTFTPFANATPMSLQNCKNNCTKRIELTETYSETTARDNYVPSHQ